MYRFDPDSDRSEEPIKKNDQMQEALLYLIARMDRGKLGLLRRL